MRLSDQTYQFVWNHHHLLLDGWSMPIVIQEVFACYEALRQGKPIQLPPVRPYRDYINWLQKQDQAAAEKYWRNELKGFTAPTPLISDPALDGKLIPEKDYDDRKLYLPEEATAKLEALARKHQLTLNTIVQGAWAILLSRYSHEQDVLFGATVSGRPAELDGVDRMVGLFINTLPVRVQVDEEQSLVPWLKQLQQKQFEQREFEYCSLADIQGWSEVPRDTPLFHSILVFENYPVNDTLQRQNTSLKASNVRSFEKTNYPITLVASPGKRFFLQIAYDTHRFSDATIWRMLNHLAVLLAGFVEHENGAIKNLSLLTEDEQRQLLVEWNNTSGDYPSELCVHEVFEAQVEKTPEAIALAFEGETMSYRALNARANQLARFLQKSGVGQEGLVGICMERSLEMIVAMLGVLKAGGAYVPMDPNYPSDRIEYMLTDSGVAILLTQQLLKPNLPQTGATMICLDADWETIARESTKNLGRTTTPENLAYLIYTSGSTGRPKGTMLNHRGLVNFCQAHAEVMKAEPNRRLLQFASISFDASVAEIYTALLSGATLQLAKQETLMSAVDLTRLLDENGVTSISLPPSMLTVMSPEGLDSLAVVLSAGEACTTDIINQWSKGRRVVNGYGPTEITIGASWSVFENLAEDVKSVHIGRPILNKQIYLLDEHLRPVPIGVAGELCVGGIGLARGYLHRPDLTAEKFIPNPFSAAAGERLYRTGDLARYRPDGNIEFLGRIDHQVKIRGFRIELGEIEAALQGHPAVKMAAVLAREDQAGEKKLVAYFVADPKAAEPTANDLYAYLKERLPDYMVPAIFMKLDEMPLTPNGKINRKVLPAPDQGRPELGRAYIAPRTQTEELVAGIMAQVLAVERVGVQDNFFELGGHSLLGVRVQSRIRDAFGIELPLRHLFESPTVEALARIIDRERLSAQGLEAPPIQRIPRDQDLPLSFAQQRLWFLDQLEPNSPFYNIPSAMRLSGHLNKEALKRSIAEIVRRHETLRTTFKAVKGKPYQVIAEDFSVTINEIDLSHLPEAEQETKVQQLATEEAQRPFDLVSGPLFRVTLISLKPDDHVVLFTLHHIISDGWSMGVLVKEVAELYQAFAEGKESPLPELPIQYADFAHWQKNWLSGEVLEKQLAYWKEKLAGSPPVIELPTDRPRPAVQSFKGSMISKRYSGELLQSLKAFCQKENVTLFMTLLAAFKTLLYRYSGQSDINVGTPHANRNRSELEGLIGFFVNTLVLRTDLSGDPNFKELVKRVRETALGAYAHQDLPFETLVEALQPQRDLSHTPLFQVMFVLQNAPAEKIELPGLTISPVPFESGTAKFDLSLVIFEEENGFTASFEYNSDLFDRSTIERMMEHFGIVLENVMADPEQKVSAVPIMSQAELNEMLYQWNKTQAEFPSHLCMHQWFENLAARNPDAVALNFAGQQLTYGEFNRRANQMARYLNKIGVGREHLVGICMERSIEMMIGIMGALKAGGAFIPLDPAYPPERLDYMITDSGISVLLTQQALVGLVNPHQAKVVCVDAEWAKIAQESDDNLNLEIDPTNLAYVIYTSGSTGKPKGTMLQHRGWCNLGRAQQLAFGQGEGDRVLQFSALSFDASVWEMVMALLSGATLSLTHREMLSTGQGLLQVLQQDEITMVTLPPSVLAVVPDADLPHLRTIITAGEACSADLVARWGKGRRFFNAYGPTETTVCASMFLVPEGYRNNPPIGKPIANFQLYVLDANWQPVPKGVPGELCIGGAGVARGYLNRPDLTAEKFIPDPFSKEKGARLYRSGDLVRYLPDGNIEFLGRIDHQVKVRGFRIELGEIEAALKDHPDILDAAAIVREDRPGDKRIVAYLIPEAGKELTVGDLRSYLRERLPEYMVPSAFMTLSEFPLSPSGKVDRKRLPAPDLSRPELGSEYVAPRNETEERLAAICAELLNLKQVGVYDNFFELGGHSLLATQFISHIRDAFQVELPLRTLFEFPTIADLAQKVLESPKISEQEQAPIEVTHRGEKSIEELLAELEQMSDEEAEALIANT
ncbi:MAG: amino acid adenylation domain-containing protein [candidate division KSB1 bacterium]|nr:amino acid adenylation domain-containing protein [candidate division KSB1 bacterium]